METNKKIDFAVAGCQKFSKLENAQKQAARNNGTRSENGRGPGGARTVLRANNGQFWIATCNRESSILVNAGLAVAV